MRIIAIRSKLKEMRCPECGHAIDLMNQSQPVCPACGADPLSTSADPLSTSSDSGSDLDEYGDVGVNEPEISFDHLTEQVKMRS